MAATINTNIASINAQRNLALSGQSLNTTMQRLSSGLRVNSAKDDAAGLAIAERMNTQVKGLTVAARNANDGISLAQTAEGALGKVGDMLQRMRELAVQASNATNSDSDRVALQAEVKQLAAEIDRVAKQTNFNGQKILDGSFAGAVFQVGANSGDNVTLGALADTRSSQLSNVTYAVNKISQNTQDIPAPAAIAKHDQEIKAGKLQIQVGDLPAIELEKIDPANSSLERLGQVVTAINNKSADTGVTAYLTKREGTQIYDLEIMSSNLDQENQPLEVKFSGFDIETTGVVSGPTKVDTADLTKLTPATALRDPFTAAEFTSTVKDDFDIALENLQKNPAAVAAVPSLATTIANYNVAATEAEKLSTAKAVYEALGYSFSTSDAPSPTTAPEKLTKFNEAVQAQADWNGLAPSTEAETYGLALQAIAPAGTSTFDFTDTAKTSEEIIAEINKLELATQLGGLDIKPNDFEIRDRGIESIDVTTQSGAWIALKKIDSAIDQINGARATLGAMQTRFENAVNNIDIQVENLSAARGRIVDADFAVETANLSRTQILQQAGTAMVAQANQIPQNVLQLLQG